MNPCPDQSLVVEAAVMTDLDQPLFIHIEHPLEESAKHRLSRANSIFQPVDLCLLSPAVSAYTASQMHVFSSGVPPDMQL